MKLKILLVIVFGLFITNSALATVGGEVTISDFKYNPKDESVYFVKNNFGGKGCPPELLKLSLNTGKTDVAFSCDQGEKLSQSANWQEGQNIVGQELNKITKDFKLLNSLNFKKNNISIKVSFSSEEKYPEFNEVERRQFLAEVYQNNVKVGDFKVPGCNLDQPFTFQGYSIPGFDKRIAILSSAKGDCFEGGYIDEYLFSLTGFSNLDKTTVSNYYKSSSPLVPNEGNLVVYSVQNKSNSSILNLINLLIEIGVIDASKADLARSLFK